MSDQRPDYEQRDLTAGDDSPGAKDAMRAWRERNRDHLRAYNAAWRERNLERARELNRLYMRRQSQKRKREEEKRERRRAYARDWYARNREWYGKQQRESRARRKAEDPEAFRAMAAARMKRWRDKNREAYNQSVRDRRRENPGARVESSRRYYEKNREQILERARQRYAANHETARAKANAYEARERRRREVGLPPNRLHAVRPTERDANQRAADEFFSRTFDRRAVSNMRLGSKEPTPPQLIAAWKRDCLRARAAHHQATAEPASPPSARDELRSARLAAKAAEDARLDAIGRAVNARLRNQRGSAALLPDPGAPHHFGATPNSPHIAR